MKNQNKLAALVLSGIALFSFISCSEDETPLIREGIEKAELVFTEVSGEGLYPHGNHFHGLGNVVDGDSHVIKFDATGRAISGGHLHLEADAIYRVDLRAWDYAGKAVQNDFISNKATADNFKAFLIGGGFTLNPDTDNQSGAIFQTRETKYGDNTDVNGQYETTGIISYFTAGHSNEGPTVDVTYVLRKLNNGVKANITRTDWNDDNYKVKFSGENVLELKFEIHAEEGHSH